MNITKTITHVIMTACLACMLILAACVPETAAPTPAATGTPSPTLPPERNVAWNKPVRVSASWLLDPPEKAVNGNRNDWWGAGGPAPQWIEVDLQGIYPVTRIKVINEGPTGPASYQVYGRGPERVSRLLHVFDGLKTNNQTLEFSPETAWEGISTIRIEIPDGSGWVGFREVEVYARSDPEPLSISAEPLEPSFLAGADTDGLEQITLENAIFMEQIAMFGRGTVNDLIWSADGKQLAAASPVGVWLYDPADLGSSPRLLEGHTREVLSAAFSRDGTRVLSGSQDGTVIQWDIVTGDLVGRIPLWNDFSYEVNAPTRDPEVWSLAISQDGNSLAAGCYDGTLRLWKNLTTGRQEVTLSGHTKLINALAFSPDGSLLASASIDGTLLVWDVESGSQRIILPNAGHIQALVFSPDGTLLAYGGTGTVVRLWNTTAGASPVELNGPTDVLSLAFSPDSLTLTITSLDGQIHLFDMESGSASVFKEGAGWIMNMAFSPDGQTLATYSWDGTIRLWDIATGNQQDGEEAHTNLVTSVAFNPDNTLLASGSSDGIVRLWDVETNELLFSLWGHNSQIYSVAFSPDGTLLASASFDRTVRLWDTATGSQVRVLAGHASYIRCLAFSPDGMLIASGSADRTVRLWDAVTGEERAVLTGFTGEIQSVAFSPDGLWLLTAIQDSTLRIWEVATGREVGIVGRHLSPEMSAAFSPDGALIASGSGDHSLHVWDWRVDSGAATGSNHFPAIGHPGWVMSVAFSPDGAIVAAANTLTASIWVAPGEIHLYSADTGFPYALLRGHTKRVTSIAFSADGKLLASGSADGSVRLWGVRRFGSTLVPQPATITPTRTLTAPPASAPWRDDFNGTLSEGWHWNSENPDKWNLAEKPGFLRIYASPYEAGGQNRNQLLRTVVPGDFTITTHVFFEPKANFQTAGLYFYQDDDDYLAFGRAYCNTAGTCVGNGIYFDYVVGGAYGKPNFATTVNSLNEAYLRLERRGDMVKAFFSYDGITWSEIGIHRLAPTFQVNGVGLAAMGDMDKSDEDIPADFDFFTLQSIP